MLTHFIVNDLPKEFGETNVISGHQNLDDAKFFLDILKGHGSQDSYLHQYYRIFSRRQLRETRHHVLITALSERPVLKLLVPKKKRKYKDPRGDMAC